MPNFISRQGIQDLTQNLPFKDDTLKARLFHAIAACYADEESMRTLEAIPAELLITQLWEVDSPKEIQARRKNLSSLKSALNKSLKDLEKQGKNPEALVIGRDNTFVVSDERKDSLIEKLGITAGDGQSMVELFSSFKKIISDMAMEQGGGDMQALLEQLDETRQLVQKISGRSAPGPQSAEGEAGELRAGMAAGAGGEEAAGTASGVDAGGVAPAAGGTELEVSEGGPGKTGAVGPAAAELLGQESGGAGEGKEAGPLFAATPGAPLAEEAGTGVGEAAELAGGEPVSGIGPGIAETGQAGGQEGQGLAPESTAGLSEKQAAEGATWAEEVVEEEIETAEVLPAEEIEEIDEEELLESGVAEEGEAEEVEEVEVSPEAMAPEPVMPAEGLSAGGGLAPGGAGAGGATWAEEVVEEEIETAEVLPAEEIEEIDEEELLEGAVAEEGEVEEVEEVEFSPGAMAPEPVMPAEGLPAGAGLSVGGPGAGEGGAGPGGVAGAGQGAGLPPTVAAGTGAGGLAGSGMVGAALDEAVEEEIVEDELEAAEELAVDEFEEVEEELPEVAVAEEAAEELEEVEGEGLVEEIVEAEELLETPAEVEAAAGDDASAEEFEEVEVLPDGGMALDEETPEEEMLAADGMSLGGQAGDGAILSGDEIDEIEVAAEDFEEVEALPDDMVPGAERLAEELPADDGWSFAGQSAGGASQPMEIVGDEEYDQDELAPGADGGGGGSYPGAAPAIPETGQAEGQAGRRRTPKMLEVLSQYLEPEEALAEKVDTLAETNEEYVAQLLERFTPKFIRIPEGDYPVGSSHPKPPEQRQRTVHLDTFHIGQFPVTNDLFELFVRDTGYETEAEIAGYGLVYLPRCQEKINPVNGRAIFTLTRGTEAVATPGASWRHPAGPGSALENRHHHPVVQVSRKDAMAFATWAGKRLPTEEEWEGAARGTGGRLFPWGNLWVASRGNFASSFAGTTTPVTRHGLEAASPFGVQDMLGNVYEWTASRLDQGGTQETLTRQREAVYILKGGAWVSQGVIAVSHRMLERGSHWSNIVGFRCVA